MTKFIVFEGIDGSGKSTQAVLLWERLKKAYITVEPTDSDIGKLCRSQIGKVPAETLAMLFAADRDNHLFGENGLENIVYNEEYDYIICDRYMFSNFAYQTVQGVDIDFLLELNSEALYPDMIFYIDIDPSVSLKRKSKLDGFESVDFLIRVREEYLKMFKELDNVFSIDGNRPEEEIHREIFKIVSENV